MPKKSFRRPTLRRALLLSAVPLLFVVAGVFSPPGSIIFTQSQAMKLAAARPAGDQVHDRKAAAKPALLRLPLSFEAGAKADQFFVRGSGYQLLVTASQTTIAATDRGRQKLLTM